MIHRDPYYETEQQLRNREIREMERERVVPIQREALQDLDCICAGCDERKPVAYTSEDGEVFCADCRYRQQHAGEREMAEAEAAAAERAMLICDPAYRRC